MDKLLVKSDPSGKDIVFVASTLNPKNKSMLCWRPENPSADLFWADYQFYSASSTVPAAKAEKIASIYAKTFGVQAITMQRIPRKLEAADVKSPAAFKRAVQALHDSEAKQATQPLPKPVEAPKEVVAAPVKPSKGYQLLKRGALWQLLNENGESLAYTVAEEDALKVLEQVMGKTNKTMH